MSTKTVLWANQVVIAQVHKNMVDLIIKKEYKHSEKGLKLLQKAYTLVVKMELCFSELEGLKENSK